MPTRRKKYKTLCAVLTQVRNDMGLSQVELSRRLGRTQSWVSKIESGEVRLDILEFLELAKALGIKADKLVRKLMAQHE